MTDYLFVKWLHVLSSTFLFGTGVGSAFYLFFVSRGGDARTIAIVAGWVVVADWLFTATTAVFQPLSGFWLAHRIGFPLSSPWLLHSIVLYTVAIACWLPVVWLQMRMRDLAREAAARRAPLPPLFHRYLRIWVALGVPALLAFLAIFWLMVAKPTD
jgi:uncharacterized membrane protein